MQNVPEDLREHKDIDSICLGILKGYYRLEFSEYPFNILRIFRKNILRVNQKNPRISQRYSRSDFPSIFLEYTYVVWKAPVTYFLESCHHIPMVLGSSPGAEISLRFFLSHTRLLSGQLIQTASDLFPTYFPLFRRELEMFKGYK